jgi:hypothetical protein
VSKVVVCSTSTRRRGPDLADELQQQARDDQPPVIGAGADVVDRIGKIRERAADRGNSFIAIESGGELRIERRVENRPRSGATYRDGSGAPTTDAKRDRNDGKIAGDAGKLAIGANAGMGGRK